MATLKEVAAAAGVSTVTASSVLSGANRVRVSKDTDQRIRQIARDLNYVPQAAARCLRTGRVHAIGFLTSGRYGSRWQAHWPEVLRGVSSVLWDCEDRLVLSLPRDEEHELEMLRQMAFGKQVDGLIVQDCRVGDPRLKILREAKIPFVSLGGEEIEDIHVVSMDVARFSTLLAKDVLSRSGALCVISADSDRYWEKSFLDGCRKTAGEAEVPYFEWTGALLPGVDWLTKARAAANGKPMGLILARNLLPELMSILGEAWLALEKDVLITHLGGVSDMAIPVPGFKVLPLDYFTLGRQTAKRLFSIVQNKENPPAPETSLIFPATLEYLLH